MEEAKRNLKLIVFYDGVCNLCNNSVKFIIKNDKKNSFLFAPLQGEYFKSLSNQKVLPDNLPDSIILYNPISEKFYFESTAVLKIVGKLKGLWKLLYVFLVIPGFIRNSIYRIIAKNRYKWFGKSESCLIPTPEIKDKFLFKND